MELRQIRVFTAVARTLSFRRAADQLHIAQPAISATIAQLERQLGAKLFDRSRQRVALTAVGRELLADGERLVQGFDRFAEQAREVARGGQGRLRVGFLASATAELLPGALRAFRTERPGIAVEAEELAPERQVADLLADRLDLALTRRLPAVHLEALAETVLVNDRLVLALPADHPLADTATVDLGACAGESFIQYHRAGSALLFDSATALARSAGFTLAVTQEVQHMGTALLLVASGLGLSLVPGCVSALGVDDVVLRPLRQTSPPIPLVAAWARDRPQPAIDTLVRLLKAQARR